MSGPFRAGAFLPAGLLLAPLAVAAPAAAATPGRQGPACAWRLAAVPNVGSGENVLQSVAMTARANGWAVDGLQAQAQSALLRWNGRSWSEVSSPDQGSLGSSLEAVSATSAADVWAVGAHDVSGPAFRRTLAMRWC